MEEKAAARRPRPDQFAEVVSAVVTFANPVITDKAAALAWDPASGVWSSVPDGH